MKKRLLALLLAAVMALCLAACGGKDELPEGGIAPDEDIPNQEYDPEWEAEQEQKYENEKYGLDLSMYDDHGEWHYDRMWVHKTEASWDAVKGYYGYIDREGNLIGQWHEEVTDDNNDYSYEEFVGYELENVPWHVPGDFQGEYAVVRCKSYGSTASGAYVEIIDRQGNSIGRFTPYFGTYSYRSHTLMLNDFAEKLCNDRLFWDFDWGEVYMSWIEDGQFLLKRIEDSPYSAYYIQDKINGYYPYLNCYDGESDFGLIAENGDHVMVDCEMDYEVTKLIPSATEETVEVYFLGADDRKYVVVLDFDGNWLTEPALVS